METAYISALAALAGSAIGGLTSFATSWTTQQAQARSAAQPVAKLSASGSDTARTPLRITPPACRAAPVRKGIIKDRAPRNQDPVSRDTLPAIRTPSVRLTALPPVRRHPSAIPLANVTGCWMVSDCPRLPARAAAIPCQHDTGHRPCIDWPHIRARPVGARGNRHGYRKHSGQGQSERAHFGTPVIQWARPSIP